MTLTSPVVNTMLEELLNEPSKHIRRRDLPFDGNPIEMTIHSRRDDIPLQIYQWPRQHNQSLRGVIVLLHGVRAHCRLTWLAKRPPDLSGLPTPIERVVRETIKENPIILQECSSSTDVGTTIAGDSSLEDSLVCFSDKDFPLQSSPPLLEHLRSFAARGSAGGSPSGSFGGLPFSPFTSQVNDDSSTTAASSPSSASSATASTSSYHDACKLDRERHIFYEGSWIEALNHMGYEVFGFDLRGHGKSGGARCVVDDFQDYADDLRQVIQDVIWTKHDPSTTKLCIVGVSLSTLIVCRLLQETESRNLNIHAVALISGFLKEGGRFEKTAYKALMHFLVKIRHIFPNLPIIMPKKPETQGPLWQLKYGEADPYLNVKPFRAKMLGNCIVALDEFNKTKQKLLDSQGCAHIKMFHNYTDPVNPIDGSMEPISYLMHQANGSIDVQCLLFNGQNMKPDEARQWHHNIEVDSRPLDLGHTLITDRDNIHVFDKFHEWLVQTMQG